MRARRVTLLMTVLPALLLATATRAGEWEAGFVAIGLDSTYQVRTPEGIIEDVLSDGGYGEATGCIFRDDFTLDGTMFHRSLVVTFDPGHPHALTSVSCLGRDGDSHPESLAFDQAGNLLVGFADEARGGGGLDVTLLDGTLLEQHAPETDSRGVDWIDLASDGRTLYYTSEGPRILRYDLVSRAQLPDFASVPARYTFALRLLPPTDGSGGLLVAASQRIFRLDGTGAIVREYDVPGVDSWFGLNIDPDGRTFWAAGSVSGLYARFDIESGEAITIVPTGAFLQGGICVAKELRASRPCGNGLLESGEECDDANLLSGDGCDDACRLEPRPCEVGEAPREVDARSLRVRRGGVARGDVVLILDARAVPVVADRLHVYRGTLAAFRTPAHYDHEAAPGGCNVTASPWTDAGAALPGAEDMYYLAALACGTGAASREGPLGFAFDGQARIERPSSVELGTTPCP